MKVYTEYRKGILFLRLSGRFNNKKLKDTIDYLIYQLGLNVIALNLSELEYISLDDIKLINNQNKIILKKKKKLLIIDKEIRHNLFKQIKVLTTEIETFSLI